MVGKESSSMALRQSYVDQWSKSAHARVKRVTYYVDENSTREISFGTSFKKYDSVIMKTIIRMMNGWVH